MSVAARLAKAASGVSSIYKIVFVSIMLYELLKRTLSEDNDDPRTRFDRNRSRSRNHYIARN